MEKESNTDNYYAVEKKFHSLEKNQEHEHNCRGIESGISIQINSFISS